MICHSRSGFPLRLFLLADSGKPDVRERTMGIG